MLSPIVSGGNGLGGLLAAFEKVGMDLHPGFLVSNYPFWEHLRRHGLR
jgi:hypothetical protein